jgi:hypothetical protein
MIPEPEKLVPLIFANPSLRTLKNNGKISLEALEFTIQIQIQNAYNILYLIYRSNSDTHRSPGCRFEEAGWEVRPPIILRSYFEDCMGKWICAML